MKNKNNGVTLLKVSKTIALVGPGTQKGGDNIRVTKSGIFFNPEHAGKLGVNLGEFILVGLDAGATYLGKKPAGIFGGYRVTKHKAKNNKRWFISLRCDKLGLPLGEYYIGAPTAQVAQDHNGKKIGFKLHRLEEI